MVVLPDTTPDQGPIHASVLSVQCAIGSFSPDGPLLFFRSQEFSCPFGFRVVLQEEVADEAADCGENSFENELFLTSANVGMSWKEVRRTIQFQPL